MPVVYITGTVSDVRYDAAERVATAVLRTATGTEKENDGGDGFKYVAVKIRNNVFLPLRKFDTVNLAVEKPAESGKKAGKFAREEYEAVPYTVGFLPEGETPVMPPSVRVSVSQESVEHFFVVCRVPAKSAASLYNYFLLAAGTGATEKDVFDCISRESLDFFNNTISKNVTEVRAALSRLDRIIACKRCDSGEIMRSWYYDVILRRFFLLGITTSEIQKMKSRVPDLMEMYSKITANPFRLIDLSLDKCFLVCVSLRVDPDPSHVAAGRVARTLAAAIETEQASAIPLHAALAIIPDLPKYAPVLREYGIVFDKETQALYLEHMLEAEIALADRLPALYLSEGAVVYADPSLIPPFLSDEQRRAVTDACSRGLVIIRGGAGTGKTTIIEAIVDQIEARNIPYLLCALSGMAAERITEATRREAFTIQSLLTKDVNEISTVARRSRTYRPSDVRAIIVDEISMAPTALIHALLKRYPNADTLVLVGDINQLPPIDPGSFMAELLLAAVFHVNSLTMNYRVITKNADTVSEHTNEIMANLARLEKGANERTDAAAGERTDAVAGERADAAAGEKADASAGFKFTRGSTFNFIRGGERELEALLRQYRATGEDIGKLGILTPYRKSAEQINNLVREIFFPHTLNNAAERTFGPFYVGARVMQNVNNMVMALKNGKEGTVRGFEFDSEKGKDVMLVEFDVVDVSCATPQKRIVKYLLEAERHGAGAESVNDDRPVVDWPAHLTRNVSKMAVGHSDAVERNTNIYISSLAVSFAATIHKYQGSQRDHIVCYFPFHPRNAEMINRNIIYTALSRARKSVNLVGDIRELEKLANSAVRPRYANLAKRLRARMALDAPPGPAYAVTHLVLDDGPADTKSPRKSPFAKRTTPQKSASKSPFVKSSETPLSLSFRNKRK
jgi:hypothetical protein